MALQVMTTLPARQEHKSPPNAVIVCAGSCKFTRTQVARWTRHIFIRHDVVPRAQAVIYACTSCGAERRYGLLGTNVDADVD